MHGMYCTPILHAIDRIMYFAFWRLVIKRTLLVSWDTCRGRTEPISAQKLPSFLFHDQSQRNGTIEFGNNPISIDEQRQFDHKLPKRQNILFDLSHTGFPYHAFQS